MLGARMLELKREPEVVFWVFVFPLLLAAGLGIAFRNKPSDASSVAIVAATGAQPGEVLLQRFRQNTSFKVDVVDSPMHRKDSAWGSMIWSSKPTLAAGCAIATTRRGPRACWPWPR